MNAHLPKGPRNEDPESEMTYKSNKRPFGPMVDSRHSMDSPTVGSSTSLPPAEQATPRVPRSPSLVALVLDLLDQSVHRFLAKGVLALLSARGTNGNRGVHQIPGGEPNERPTKSTEPVSQNLKWPAFPCLLCNSAKRRARGSPFDSHLGTKAAYIHDAVAAVELYGSTQLLGGGRKGSTS